MVPGRSLGWQGWLVGFLILAVLGLTVALIIFVVKANSKACKDGLLAEEECHSVTRLLEVQLTQAWEGLLRNEVQAATCNETVVTLLASLEMEKAQSQEWLAKGEELRGEKAQNFPRRRIRRDGSSIEEGRGRAPGLGSLGSCQKKPVEGVKGGPQVSKMGRHGGGAEAVLGPRMEPGEGRCHCADRFPPTPPRRFSPTLGEIEELKHKLQNASVEAERLRKGAETSSKKKEIASASSLKALSPLVVSVHLLLAFVALLA
uniref:Bone marrow stromal cell antigen 2 n=1 Tax=Lynx canadensis TaxID=61383 RepID=A0A667GI53_LYNCA